MVKQVTQAILALGIAILLMLVVRAYAFTIYTAPTDIGTMLHRGDRVMVNRLSHAPLHRGDLVAYERHGHVVARIIALPGDTITVQGERYLIPERCCDRCSAPDCRLYLVDEGARRMLIYRHQLAGRAYYMFHLPF